MIHLLYFDHCLIDLVLSQIFLYFLACLDFAVDLFDQYFLDFAFVDHCFYFVVDFLGLAYLVGYYLYYLYYLYFFLDLGSFFLLQSFFLIVRHVLVFEQR